MNIDSHSGKLKTSNNKGNDRMREKVEDRREGGKRRREKEGEREKEMEKWRINRRGEKGYVIANKIKAGFECKHTVLAIPLPTSAGSSLACTFKTMPFNPVHTLPVMCGFPQCLPSSLGD